MRFPKSPRAGQLNSPSSLQWGATIVKQTLSGSGLFLTTMEYCLHTLLQEPDQSWAFDVLKQLHGCYGDTGRCVIVNCLTISLWGSWLHLPLRNSEYKCWRSSSVHFWNYLIFDHYERSILFCFQVFSSST